MRVFFTPAIRLSARTAAVLALSLSLGCRHSKSGPTFTWPTVPLVVQNNGFFDVTVYALPSSASQTRVRLGMAPGSSKTTLTIPPRARQSDGSVVLLLHAIGGRSSWVSPAVTIPEGQVARLDIQSDSSGDVSRSSFYTSISDFE